ncbi:MAG TPA: hypothetical protein VKB93_10410 [Thermoanaerobaculia bacterium]|nr:hypothetical protein [Thermoanaerobaculia bacterium]
MRAPPPARLDEFNDHARRTGWLYTKSVEYDGRAYVHIPLVYTTRVEPELEAYARALARFPRLVDVPFDIEVRHGVVAVFDPRDLDAFVAQVSCLSWTGRIACPPLAERVLRAETETNEETLREAQEALIDAIALNLANPFVELAHPAERANVRFSVDRWFHERAQTLRVEWRDIVDFSWEAGFLPRRRDVRAIWSDPARLADHLGYTGPRPPLKPAIRMPDIPVPASDNLLTMLGELEEFRHYWQARFYARL